ncbi:MAG TPA: winged helix-turn-helix domain-containing protein [archaeon]|nr:winged helix-turn-helix domain-containing protein [archaeon]
MITIKERGLIIQWDEKGKAQQEIAELLNCHQSSVSRFLKKYKHKKMIENMPRSGRPTKLTKKKIKQLKTKILAEIELANKEFCSVNTKQISKMIHQEVGEIYSLRHVERIMHKIGFSLITPRPQHLRHDQKKVDQFRDEFKKKSKRNTWAMN